MNNEFLKNKTEELVTLCKATGVGSSSVVITGHDMPDCDSILSAVMLRELLTRLGVFATVKFGTCPDGVTLRDCLELDVLEGVGFDGFTPSDRLVLVDHHVTFYNNEVIACVDHHTTPPEPHFALNLVQKASSCGRIVYDMARAVGRSDDWMEKMAIYSVYLDTQSCGSPKFDQNDIPWLKDGIGRLGLKENELVRMGYCLNSVDESAEILAMYAYKRYEHGGGAGASNCVQIDPSEERWRSKIEEIIGVICRRMEAENLGLWALVINKPEIKQSDVYYIRPKGSVELLKLDRLASRSRDVVPLMNSLKP